MLNLAREKKRCCLSRWSEDGEFGVRIVQRELDVSLGERAETLIEVIDQDGRIYFTRSQVHRGVWLGEIATQKTLLFACLITGVDCPIEISDEALKQTLLAHQVSNVGFAIDNYMRSFSLPFLPKGCHAFWWKPTAYVPPANTQARINAHSHTSNHTHTHAHTHNHNHDHNHNQCGSQGSPGSGSYGHGALVILNWVTGKLLIIPAADASLTAAAQVLNKALRLRSTLPLTFNLLDPEYHSISAGLAHAAETESTTGNDSHTNTHPTSHTDSHRGSHTRTCTPSSARNYKESSRSRRSEAGTGNEDLTPDTAVSDSFMNEGMAGAEGKGKIAAVKAGDDKPWQQNLHHKKADDDEIPEAAETQDAAREVVAFSDCQRLLMQWIAEDGLCPWSTKLILGSQGPRKGQKMLYRYSLSVDPGPGEADVEEEAVENSALEGEETMGEDCGIGRSDDREDKGGSERKHRASSKPKRTAKIMISLQVHLNEPFSRENKAFPIAILPIPIEVQVLAGLQTHTRAPTTTQANLSSSACDDGSADDEDEGVVVHDLDDGETEELGVSEGEDRNGAHVTFSELTIRYLQAVFFLRKLFDYHCEIDKHLSECNTLRASGPKQRFLPSYTRDIRYFDEKDVSHKKRLLCGARLSFKPTLPSRYAPFTLA